MPQPRFKIDTASFDRTSILILVFMFAMLLLTVAVYFPGLTGPLLTDDIPQLKGLIDHSADPVASLLEKN